MLGIIRKYKTILKPLFIGTSCLVAISLLYIAGCIFVEYQQYLQTYQKEQQAELAVVQNNTQKISQKLKEFLQLTGKRIGASHGDQKRTQSILNSSLRLYEPYELPKSQNLSYYKLSKPQGIITRLGIFPLKPDRAASDQFVKADSTIVFHKDVVKGKVSVLNEQGNIDGFLELDILLEDFKTTLGNFQALVFGPIPSSQTKSYHLVKEGPFSIYVKNPYPLWQFAFVSKNHYAIFFLYVLLLVFISILCALYFYRYVERSFRDNLENLKTALAKSIDAEEKASQRALVYEQRYKSHQTSSQSHRKIQEALNTRQQESLLQVHRFLTLLKQSFSHVSPPLSSERQMEIIESCLEAIHLLSNGLVAHIKKEPVKFSALLQEIFSLLAEKIYKANISLECGCSERIIFYGDALFTEVILMNVIGKAVHRVTKNEKIFINVTSQNQFICFNLQDRGFPATNELEHHVKRSFDFVIPEDMLQGMCRDAGMSYTYSRSEDGFNVNEILIPTSSEENSGNNVVQLFT